MPFSLTVLAFVASSEIVRPPPAEQVAALDRARIGAHLEEVERELRRRDVSELPLAAQAARARALDRLRDYREAGVYPHNDGYPAERVPYFVDSEGRPCAMAYLIREGGAVALAARITEQENNARIDRMRTDLQPWLAANGMTAAEAQRIQPDYEFSCKCSDEEKLVCVQQPGADGPEQVTYVNRCAALECAGLTPGDILHEGACRNAPPGRSPSLGEPNCACADQHDASCECGLAHPARANAPWAALGAGALLLGAVLRILLRRGQRK